MSTCHSTHGRHGRVPVRSGILSPAPPTRGQPAMLRSRSGRMHGARGDIFTFERSSSIYRTIPSRDDCASSIPYRQRFRLWPPHMPGDRDHCVSNEESSAGRRGRRYVAAKVEPGANEALFCRASTPFMRPVPDQARRFSGRAASRRTCRLAR